MLNWQGELPGIIVCFVYYTALFKAVSSSCGLEEGNHVADVVLCCGYGHKGKRIHICIGLLLL